ncbi:hypothetical protein [Nonomuraea guangzhouensis]|uniref:ANTAR domain-containing protein n=1 Tax=Nonomuraea guangzhouensis TaxID=1291555 RepID=A0ABW4GT46_9ACTN|nr:hypothetical protein [Nonomuraea guangzhouensis]
MSGAFAEAVRERARLAQVALRAADRDQDLNEALVAEAEWEHITRVARTHGVRLAEDVSIGLNADTDGADDSLPGDWEQGAQR